MDFSGLLLMPLAGIITAIWLIFSAITRKPDPGFRAPFLLAYGIGFLFLQPWLIASWQDAGMMAVMLIMLALWMAAGCVLGAIPAPLIVTLARKIWGSLPRFGS